MYFQLRQSVVLPFYKARGSGEGYSEAVYGSTSYLQNTMSPLYSKRSSAKDLLLKDADYSTPQDHYFGYVNRQSTLSQDEVQRELKVLRDLVPEKKLFDSVIEPLVKDRNIEEQKVYLFEQFDNLPQIEKRMICR